MAETSQPETSQPETGQPETGQPETTSKNPIMKLLERWTNSDGVKAEEFKGKMTCRPNCDSSKGGPPFVTVSFALFLVIFHYAYDGFQQIKDDRVEFEDQIIKIGPLLSEIEFKNFETLYSADLKIKDFSSTRSFLLSLNLADFQDYNWEKTANLEYQTIEETMIFNPSKRGEIWRYFTHCFLHADNRHLWVNVFMLLLAGIPLELIHDGANVSMIFTAGTIIGAFLSYATDTSLLLGASAGVYAVLFAHIGNTIMNGDLMSPKNLGITLILNIPLLGLFLYDVINIGLNKDSGTSFTAHLGGLITGLTFGTCIIRNFNVQNWENVLKYVCWVIFVLFAGGLFLCQFNSFDLAYTQLYQDSIIELPKISAGGWGCVCWVKKVAADAWMSWG